MKSKTSLIILLITFLIVNLTHAFERTEENMDFFKFLFPIAHAAGSIHKCGVSKKIGDQALNKIIKASTCKYRSGEMSKEDGMAIGEALIQVFFKSRQGADGNPPTAQMCEAGKYLVHTMAVMDKC